MTPATPTPAEMLAAAERLEKRARYAEETRCELPWDSPLRDSYDRGISDHLFASRVLRAVARVDRMRGANWRASYGVNGGVFITDQGDKSLVEALEEL